MLLYLVKMCNLSVLYVECNKEMDISYLGKVPLGVSFFSVCVCVCVCCASALIALCVHY